MALELIHHQRWTLNDEVILIASIDDESVMKALQMEMMIQLIPVQVTLLTGVTFLMTEMMRMMTKCVESLFEILLNASLMTWCENSGGTWHSIQSFHWPLVIWSSSFLPSDTKLIEIKHEITDDDNDDDARVLFNFIFRRVTCGTLLCVAVAVVVDNWSVTLQLRVRVKSEFLFNFYSVVLFRRWREVWPAAAAGGGGCKKEREDRSVFFFFSSCTKLLFTSHTVGCESIFLFFSLVPPPPPPPAALFFVSLEWEWSAAHQAREGESSLANVCHCSNTGNKWNTSSCCTFSSSLCWCRLLISNVCNFFFFFLFQNHLKMHTLWSVEKYCYIHSHYFWLHCYQCSLNDVFIYFRGVHHNQHFHRIPSANYSCVPVSLH